MPNRRCTEARPATGGESHDSQQQHPPSRSDGLDCIPRCGVRDGVDVRAEHAPATHASIVALIESVVVALIEPVVAVIEPVVATLVITVSAVFRGFPILQS